jgi:hypothetical protein
VLTGCFPVFLLVLSQQVEFLPAERLAHLDELAVRQSFDDAGLAPVQHLVAV